MQSSTAPAAAADELAGSWTTVGPVTCEQWTTAINAAFTPEQLAPYGEMLRACPAAIALRFLDGELTVNINGTDAWGPGPYRIIDDHTFEAGDDCSFCVRYQFEVEGDMLTIDVVKDDDPAGLEDSIAQTGIYESVPFERASAR